jgi:polyphosphate kinase 2 (PPK2 family)
MLVEDGIILVKYWFSISDEEQERRFKSRMKDPMRSWKLSPIDIESRARWVEYSKAKDEMFVHTDIPEAPWYVVEAEDKRRARLNCIAHLLSVVPYTDLIVAPSELPPRPDAGDYERPPRELFHYVPDFAQALLDHERVG